MRDHSFGLRDWNYIPRWVIMYATLYHPSNSAIGDIKQYTYLTLAWIQHPLNKTLTVGYLYDSHSDKFITIDNATPDLVDIGEEYGQEGEQPLQSLHFKIHIPEYSNVAAGRGGWLEGNAVVDQPVVFDMDKKAIIHEQFAQVSRVVLLIKLINHSSADSLSSLLSLFCIHFPVSIQTTVHFEWTHWAWYIRVRLFWKLSTQRLENY